MSQGAWLQTRLEGPVRNRTGSGGGRHGRVGCRGVSVRRRVVFEPRGRIRSRCSERVRLPRLSHFVRYRTFLTQGSTAIAVYQFPARGW